MNKTNKTSNIGFHLRQQIISEASAKSQLLLHILNTDGTDSL